MRNLSVLSMSMLENASTVNPSTTVQGPRNSFARPFKMTSALLAVARRFITKELGLGTSAIKQFNRRKPPTSSRRRQRALAATSPGPPAPKKTGFLDSPIRRIIFGIPAAILVVAGVVVGLSALKGGETVSYDNGIWLNRAWTHGKVDEARISELAGQLKQNKMGKLYAYASTLNAEGRWTAGTQGAGNFMESRLDVADFVEKFRERHQEAVIFAWIEIWTNLDPVDGYRLDSMALHENVADFSRLLVEDLGFDGILLDVKPLYNENDDLIRLIRSVRSAIGIEKPIAVAVPADLTPTDAGLVPLASIAPGTMWSSNYKQRVMVSADEVVLLMYQSYRQDTLDYINWVAYHIETYINLLGGNTRIMVSIPNYGGPSAAHNPSVETMSAALDGVILGVSRLAEADKSLLTGVAIFSDEDLNQSQWNLYRETWLQR